MVNLASFDLNLLKIFDAMMREGSTVRAGERLGLSQPAVSAALGRLRQALGDELFVRRGNRLVPTDYARGIEMPVRNLLRDLEGCLTGPRFDPMTATDTFRISGLDFFAETLMPELARVLGSQAPHIRVRLVNLVQAFRIEALDQQEIDIALAPEQNVPDWLEGIPRLFRSPFTVIARRDHPRLQGHGIRPGEVIPLDLFCDIDQVLCSPNGNFHAQTDEALENVGRRRRVIMSMPFFSGVTRVVAATDCLSVVPIQYARAVAPRLGLELYRAPVPVSAPAIGMFWHRVSTAAPAHRWLRDKVAEILARLDEPPPAQPRAD